MKPELFLGFGGNLGDVKESCRAAISTIRDSSYFKIKAVSSAYKTAALTLSGVDTTKPYYWNIVVRAECALEIGELLTFCQELECSHGRDTSAPRWSSRTLDIDILAWGSLAFQSADLQVPHPRCLERSFVLAPWYEIAPEFSVQLNGNLTTVAEAWKRLETTLESGAGIVEVANGWLEDASARCRQAMSAY